MAVPTSLADSEPDEISASGGAMSAACGCHSELEAAIRAHLSLVTEVARRLKFSPRDAGWDDLLIDGQVALWRGLQEYDATKEPQVFRFLRIKIRWAMTDGLRSRSGDRRAKSPQPVLVELDSDTPTPALDSLEHDQLIRSEASEALALVASIDCRLPAIVTIHRVYIQPTPTNTTQLGKVQAHILHDLEARGISYADDRGTVTPGDEDIRFTFEIESGSQKDVLAKLTHDLGTTQGEFNDLKNRHRDLQRELEETKLQVQVSESVIQESLPPKPQYDVLGDPQGAPVGTVVTGLSLVEGSRFREEVILQRVHSNDESMTPWMDDHRCCGSNGEVSQNYTKAQVLRWGPRP